MKLSHIFGFLKILKESIKLVPKNGKIMAAITILSLLLPSLLFLLLIYFHKFLTNTNKTPTTFHLALLLPAGIACQTAIFAISSLSATAVILVSAMSYTGKKASMADLLSRINRYRTKQHSSGNFHKSRKLLVAAALAAYIVTFDHSAVTTTIIIVAAIAIFFYLRYASVVGFLATVVSVVEESSDGGEAVEKAEHLAIGHRLHGFMLNLFVVFPVWNIFLVHWIVLDEEWYLNIAMYGLLFVNSQCLGQIFFGISYTVLYFECKKHHGQEIDYVLGKE